MASTPLQKYVRSPQPITPESQPRYLETEYRKIEDVLRSHYGAMNSTGPYMKMPAVMLLSSQDQASAGTTSENLVTFNEPVVGKGASVVSNSQIHFDHPGYYLVTFSLMFANRSNAAHEIEVWAKRGSTNYPLSNTRFDIAARKSDTIWSNTVATVTGIFDVQDITTDYLQIAWWADGGQVYLERYDAGTNPTRPEIPSVILTANFVSGL